jgi:hypothetical protein
VRWRFAERLQLLHALLQRIGAAEYAEARLHRLLHQRTDLARLVAALAVPDSIEALERALLRATVRLAYERPRFDDLCRPQRRHPTEDDQIEQAVGAEAAGAVHETQAASRKPQAASPTAIRPGTTASESNGRRTSCGRRRLTKAAPIKSVIWKYQKNRIIAFELRKPSLGRAASQAPSGGHRCVSWI